MTIRNIDAASPSGAPTPRRPDPKVVLGALGVAALAGLTVAPWGLTTRILGICLIGFGVYMIWSGKTVVGTFKGSSGGTTVEGGEAAVPFVAGVFLLIVSWLLGGG